MAVLTRSRDQEMGSLTMQNNLLRVVHPRGYVEVFSEPITAGEIMRRYPRHCITRPDVFEFPWIVVRPESVLVPGKSFYLVPHHTIYKIIKARAQQPQPHQYQPRQQQTHQEWGNHEVLRSCLKREDSARNNLNLKVSFASPLVVRRGLARQQRDDLVPRI